MDVQQSVFASGVRTSARTLIDKHSLILREFGECEFQFSGSGIELWLGYSRDGPCCLITIPAERVEREHLYQFYKRQFGEPAFLPENPWAASESIKLFMEMLGPVLNRYA
jgi:hypothetical protein